MCRDKVNEEGTLVTTILTDIRFAQADEGTTRTYLPLAIRQTGVMLVGKRLGVLRAFHHRLHSIIPAATQQC